MEKWLKKKIINGNMVKKKIINGNMVKKKEENLARKISKTNGILIWNYEDFQDK